MTTNPDVTTEAPAAAEERREIYLDRRICTITPDKIELRPARSIVFMPLITLLLGLSVFPIVGFWGGSLPVFVLLLLTFSAIILVPLSGLGLVYSIAGAHMVIDRAKQSAVLQQGYLGMGVGTQELVPFWKIDKVVVRELTPHDHRGHQDDFAQYEIYILKVSGKEVSVGMVTTARAEAEDGLARATEVAELIGAMSGSTVEAPRPRREHSSRMKRVRRRARRATGRA